MHASATHEKTMEPAFGSVHERYARCIEASRRIRWEIDRDVIRGRCFDFGHRFLPDRLSLVTELDFLEAADRVFYSQVQGRTYANMFALVERFVNAKVLELSRRHWLGDQVALEALVRLSDEEIKHQELFRRIDRLAAEGMPSGYEFVAEPNRVASVVLGKSTWSVLALTCNIELLSQTHYRDSIRDCDDLSPLFKDVFLFHWKEESQHAILDELEWRAEHETLSEAERDRGVDDLIALVGAIDAVLRAQAGADAEYFAANAGRAFDAGQRRSLEKHFLKAYRWQYILSGAVEERFTGILASLTTDGQRARIEAELAALA